MSQKSGLAEHLTTSYGSGAEWLIFRSSNHFPVLIELLRKMAAAQSRESPTVSQAQEALVFGTCGDQTKIHAKFQLHSRKLLDACNASCGGEEILDPKKWSSRNLDAIYLNGCICCLPGNAKNLGRHTGGKKVVWASPLRVPLRMQVRSRPPLDKSRELGKNWTPWNPQLPKLREVLDFISFRSPSWLTKSYKVGEDLLEWFIVAGFVWFSVPVFQSSVANKEVQKDLTFVLLGVGSFFFPLRIQVIGCIMLQKNGNIEEKRFKTTWYHSDVILSLSSQEWKSISANAPSKLGGGLTIAPMVLFVVSCNGSQLEAEGPQRMQFHHGRRSKDLGWALLYSRNALATQ